MTDYATLLGDANGSVVALYSRWKAENGADSHIALCFARAFEACGQLNLSCACIVRATRDAACDSDFISIAEFVRAERELTETALEILHKGVEAHPGSAILWDAIADTHRLGNSDWRTANASYLSFKRREFHKDVEDIHVAWASFGWMLSEVGHYQLAEEAYRSSVVSPVVV